MSLSRPCVPLPCRYFHTAQGCPYGSHCKFDHYSNNPSYFNHIKQKLHSLSKPKSHQNLTHSNFLKQIINSVQQCFAQIINKEIQILYREINGLKSTIDEQNKLIQKTKKPLTASSFTKQMSKMTKLLKQNHAAIASTFKQRKVGRAMPQTHTKDEHELDDILTKIQSQVIEFKADKALFDSHILTSSEPPQLATDTALTHVHEWRNIFESETESEMVTMDQISALPVPPKTKPKSMRPNQIPNQRSRLVSVSSEFVRDSGDVRKHTLHQTQKKKMKSNRHLKKVCDTTMKRTCNENKEKTMKVVSTMPIYNDLDWYQIVNSDSSDDERNMSTEDAQKLDMLHSI